MAKIIRSHAASRLLLAALMVGVLAGCAGLDLKSDRQVSRERLTAYLVAHPETDRTVAAAMRKFTVRQGMTPEQVTAVWGAPHEIRKWRNGKVTQWLFPCGWPAHCFPGDTRSGIVEPQYTEAYFEKGRLVRWWSP